MTTTASGPTARRRDPRTWSTGLQLTVLIVVVVLAGFFVAGFVALRISTGEQLRQIDRSLDESVSGARQLADTLSDQQIDTLSSVASIVTFAVVDVNGTPATDAVLGRLGNAGIDLSSLGPNRLLARVGDPFSFTTPAGQRLRVLIAPTGAGGYIVGLAELDRVRLAEDRLSTQLFLVGLAVSAAIALLIWGGVNSILAPMRTMVGKARDISRGTPGIALDLQHGAIEVRHLGHALDDMRTALSASSERTRRFAADASHDLRTPLSIIRGQIQLQRSGAATGDAWTDIESAADRMEHLIDDLLFLSRGETLDPTRSGLVDLGEVVDAAVAARSALDGERQYRWSRPNRPALVEGDEAQLRRAVDNMLDNVATHTPVGTTAMVELVIERSTIRCTVTDDGPGLSPADVARAADRFWRADRSRSTPGTGLGLAIVDTIARAHRGRLAVSGGPNGVGLSVTIDLPSAAR